MRPPAASVLTTFWGSPRGITTDAATIHRLWTLTYLIAIPLGAIVIGAIVWCVVRYGHRQGENRRAEQFQYHIPIELAYTVIPLVIVVVIFGFVYGAENRIDNVNKHPDVAITVQGFQWGWRFIYPNGHQEVGSVANDANINTTTGLPILYMPENERVQFTLQSDDVNHSFYVPEFLVKRDLIQGINNVIDITATQTGHFIGECTQLCGTYHAFMRFEVDIMTKAQYAAWYSHTTPNSITYAGSTGT